MMLSRDMILPIKHKVDFNFLRQCEKAKIDYDSYGVNKSWARYNYQVGNQAIIENTQTNKYYILFKINIL